MFKRVGLFILTNILVMVTVSVIMSVFGIGNYVTAYGLDYTSLLAFCLVWGMVGSFISLLMSKFMAKTMMGVQIVELHGPYNSLVQRIHAIARKAGIKEPEVGIYDSPEVNAFATGPSRNNSLVAVSTGLLQKMDDDEVEGVLAHEVAHIANGDMVTMALIQGVVNAFVMFLARVVTFAIDQAMRGDDDNGRGLGFFAHIILVNVLHVVFGLMAAPIVMGFSRWREYRADSGSGELVGKHKMIAALEALKRNYETLSGEAPEGMKSMRISSKDSIFKLFASHPSLDDRIKALR